MDYETDQALSRVATGSVYTNTFHIGNLRDYGGGRTLTTDWADRVIGKYSAYFRVPLLSPDWPTLAAYTTSRNAHFAELGAGVDAVYDAATNTVTRHLAGVRQPDRHRGGRGRFHQLRLGRVGLDRAHRERGGHRHAQGSCREDGTRLRGHLPVRGSAVSASGATSSSAGCRTTAGTWSRSPSTAVSGRSGRRPTTSTASWRSHCGVPSPAGPARPGGPGGRRGERTASRTGGGFASSYDALLASMLAPHDPRSDQAMVARSRFLLALRGIYEYASDGGDLHAAMMSNAALNQLHRALARRTGSPS